MVALESGLGNVESAVDKKVERLKAMLPDMPYPDHSPEMLVDRMKLMVKGLSGMPPSVISTTLLQINEKNPQLDRETIEAHIAVYEHNKKLNEG